MTWREIAVGQVVLVDNDLPRHRRRRRLVRGRVLRKVPGQDGIPNLVQVWARHIEPKAMARWFSPAELRRAA